MSWLFKSSPLESSSSGEPQSPTEGVKDDLSEFGKTIGRQLWDVASFLAPQPPTGSTSTATDDAEEEEEVETSQALVGIRNDLAEISGRFKSGLSLFSSNIGISDISKLASNLLQFEEEEEGGDEEEVEEEVEEGDSVVGVTEEVLEFVKDLSTRVECWVDFPLKLDDWDFDMSDAQKEHVASVESLTPSLSDLKTRLCPSYINENQFWLIYFILLHQRLDEDDSSLLSTPQILEAREILLQGLQNRTSPQSETSNFQEEVKLIHTANEKVNDKEGINVDDQWLEEEDVETASTSFSAQNQVGNEQDLSFSDLEEDDHNNETSCKQGDSSPVLNVAVSSPNGSSGWVQLSENSDSGEARKQVRPKPREKYSEGDESSDWLAVDGSDSDSAGTT